MESTGDLAEPLIATSTISSNVEERESPAGPSICSSDSTPEQIGGVVPVPLTKIEPGASRVVNYNRPRANASAGRHGSAIPCKPVDFAPSPTFKAGLGPSMRTSRDAHQVIMGENPIHPPRNSSRVSQLSRPTASDSARAVGATTAASSNRHTGAVKIPNPARSTSSAITPSAVRSTDASQIPSARPGSTSQVSFVARHGSVTQTSSATRTPTPALTTSIARSPSGIQSTIVHRADGLAQSPNSARSATPMKATTATGLTNAGNSTPTRRVVRTANSGSAVRSVTTTKPASTTRSAKARKYSTVAANPSVKRVHNARAIANPKPPSGAINSLKSTGRGFKSRISAMIANRRPATDFYEYGSEPQPGPLFAKAGEAQCPAKTGDANLVASLLSNPPNGGTVGDDINNFLSMSRDQLDRLTQVAQGMDGEKREGAMKAVNAFGEALVAVTAARKANMDLSAAIVCLSRQATDLGSQALAVIQG